MSNCSSRLEAMGNSERKAEKGMTNFRTARDYIQMSYRDALLLDGFYHAAHCMIFAKWNGALFNHYKSRAAVLMQMRFDGRIGFPGGLLNRGENPVDAVNREMVEEINLNLSKHRVTKKEHVISHANNKTKHCEHFFVLKVTMDEFIEIEKRCLDAKEYGRESLGVLRVCLYTMTDRVGGFPSFLKHNFIGNCKEQLCLGLKVCNIMTEQEIFAALNLSKEIRHSK